ncbi:hypothetical protein HDU86_000544 [Geranomyces michiganensis]|nr:hypothetical protein HDU86_000544 [Geranomyces michiganensis]
MFGGPLKAWSFLPRDKSELALSPREWNSDAGSSTSTLIGEASSRKSPAFGPSLATLAIDTSGVIRHDSGAATSAIEGEGGKSLLELCQDGNEEALYSHCYDNAGLIVQSVNVPMDNAGNTLMHLAVSMNDLGLTSMLLLKGADPNAPNKGGITPTIIAKRMMFTVLQTLLTKHGGVVPSEEEKIGSGTGILTGLNSNVQAGGRRKSGRKSLDVHRKRLTSDLELLASDSVGNESRRASQAGAPLSEVHAASSDLAGDSTAGPGGLDVPLQPAVVFPTHRLPIYDAAYLGLAADQISALPNSFLVAADDFGSTPLMKAAMRGHMAVVKALIARGVDTNRADKHGNTALTWAAFSGQLDCVKALTAVKGCLVDGYTPPPDGSSPIMAVAPLTPEQQHQRDREALMLKTGMTPLVAASISGHVAVVEHLLDCGASMDLKSGPGPTRTRTAVMYAAWMRREDVVRVLVRRGCSVDPDTDHWLKKGVIYLKRANLDYNVWTGSVGTFSKMVLNAAAPSPSRGRRMSLKDKMSYFSSEEHDALLALEAIMTGGTALSKMTPVSPGGALSKSSGNICKSSASLFSLSENEASSYHALNDPNPLLAAPDAGTMRRERRGSRPRARNRHRHGMNFDKLFGANPEVVAELTEQIPSRGTELDALWVAVFQHVIQLLIAANQNKKAHFIIISAKAIHNAGEIIRAIEIAEKQALMQSAPGVVASSSVMLKPPSPSSINASSAATMFPALYVPHPEQNLFNGTIVRARMRELSKLVKNELPKQLMLTTRIAIGVWPPQHAMSDMIKAATDLARTCRELTDVANLSGMFHLVDRSLDVQFTAFEEDDEAFLSKSDENESDQSLAAKNAIPASLTYEEYKRQNDLKVLEEITKLSSASRAAAQSAGDAQGATILGEQHQLQETRQQEQAADAAFFSKLEELVRALVEVIKDIKRAFINEAKAAYVTASATAAHRAEVIIDELRQYDLFAEFPEDLMFDEDDAAALATKGVTIGGVDNEIFPIQVADLWYAALTDVRQAARTVAMKGKLASGVMPPPTAAEEMVRATIPCLIAVKKLVTIAKESAAKVRRTSFDKVSKQEKWERDVAQNEHVKSLFLLWERQVLRPQQDGEEEAASDIGAPRRSAGVAPSAEVDSETQEMELLRDDLDGLVLESAGNSKLIVRGGKLNKLVEWMTSHIHYDHEFTANMLLTHHSFTTTSELLDLLFRRYSLVAPPALSRSQYDTFLQRKIFPVKQRVCTVLKTWLELLFEDDFLGGNQHVGVFKLRDFCSEVVVKDSEVWGRELMGLVEQKLNRASNPQPTPAAPTPVGPPPKLPRLPPETDIQALLSNSLLYHDLDPLELARQLAILDQAHFARIKPHECLDQIWGEKRRKEMGLSKHADPAAVTGLGEMIRHTNVVTIWIANCIIRNEDLKARREALKYFAHMAVHCQELNNFNGITALNAAMSTAAVNRLHKTWDAFREKYPKLYEAYEDAASTVSPKGQYANYRKVLKDLAPPAVPFLGVSLTDLTFTELGNPDFLPETPALINFDKRRKVCQVLTNSIQKYQAVPYNLVPVAGIRNFLSGLGSLPLLNDDELYQMSLKVEPKEEELSDEEGGDEGG